MKDQSKTSSGLNLVKCRKNLELVWLSSHWSKLRRAALHIHPLWSLGQTGHCFGLCPSGTNWGILSGGRGGLWRSWTRSSLCHPQLWPGKEPESPTGTRPRGRSSPNPAPAVPDKDTRRHLCPCRAGHLFGPCCDMCDHRLCASSSSRQRCHPAPRKTEPCLVFPLQSPRREGGVFWMLSCPFSSP